MKLRNLKFKPSGLPTPLPQPLTHSPQPCSCHQGPGNIPPGSKLAPVRCCSELGVRAQLPGSCIQRKGKFIGNYVPQPPCTNTVQVKTKGAQQPTGNGGERGCLLVLNVVTSTPCGTMFHNYNVQPPLHVQELSTKHHEAKRGRRCQARVACGVLKAHARPPPSPLPPPFLRRGR